MAYQPPPGYPPAPGGYGPPPGAYGPPPGYGPYGQYGQQPYGQYGPPAGAPRRTTHPLATAALVLGLLAFCTTLVTGVPAILLGSKAVRQIEAHPDRFEGKGTAKAGVVLGWIGCALFAIVLGRAMGEASLGLGVLAVVLGLAMTAGVLLLAKKRSWGALRGATLALYPALLIAASIFGIAGAHAEAAAKVATCHTSESAATAQLAAKNFIAARKALDTARSTCPATEEAHLAEWNRSLVEQEQQEQKAEADRLAAQQAAAAAAKEKQAVETFPHESTAIANLYKRALSETYSGRWEAADKDLTDAEAGLANFKGTSVEQSKQYQDLLGQITALQQKVNPQLEKLEKQRQARAEAAQAAEDDQTLRDMLAQYKDNEVRADAIYKGKEVQFGGIVGDIKKDITDTIYVTVGTGEWLQIPQVQCFFPDEKASETAQLRGGQHVRMRGTVKGLMMNVLVEDCDIVQ